MKDFFVGIIVGFFITIFIVLIVMSVLPNQTQIEAVNRGVAEWTPNRKFKWIDKVAPDNNITKPENVTAK